MQCNFILQVIISFGLLWQTSVSFIDIQGAIGHHLGKLFCPNDTDKIEMLMNLELSAKIGRAVAGAIPFIGQYLKDPASEVIIQLTKCKEQLKALKKAQMLKEKQAALEKTHEMMEAMYHQIVKGFKELREWIVIINKKIAEGHIKMDEVRELVAEEKYSKYKLKLENIMSRLQLALDSTDDGPKLDYIAICNNAENNDKYLILQLDDVISTDESTYAGLLMRKHNYIDRSFIDAFNIVDLLIPNLRRMRSACFLFTEKISYIDDKIRQIMVHNVQSQINEVYSKIKLLNAEREMMYFNEEILFSSFKKNDNNLATMEPGFAEYWNANYVYFDCSNYTVYRKFRYFISFSSSIPSTITMAYDPMYVAIITADMKTYNDPNPSGREKIHLVRSRINDNDNIVPAKFLDELDKFLEKEELVEKVMHNFWCKFEHYRLISVMIRRVGDNLLPDYPFGNCYSDLTKRKTHQITACFVLAYQPCGLELESLSHNVKKVKF